MAKSRGHDHEYLSPRRSRPSVQHPGGLQDAAPAAASPGTGQPSAPDLAPLFPMELIKDVSQQRWIEIPDEVRDICALRPTRLSRAPAREALDRRAPTTIQGVSPRAATSQSPSRRRTTTSRGRRAPVDRDRRRPVGLGLVQACTSSACSARSTWSRFLSPEAVSRIR